MCLHPCCPSGGARSAWAAHAVLGGCCRIRPPRAQGRLRGHQLLCCGAGTDPWTGNGGSCRTCTDLFLLLIPARDPDQQILPQNIFLRPQPGAAGSAGEAEPDPGDKIQQERPGTACAAQEGVSSARGPGEHHPRVASSPTMPLSQSRARQLPCSSKVCRNLFGPVDHDQLQNDLDDLLRQNLEEAQQRWNFDFETETPLEGHFKWERVFLDDQPPQEVRSPVKITGGESRSSLVHKVSPKSRLGRIRPEESQQSLEIHRAGSPKILKRGQSTIKDFYSSKRRIVPDKPKP